MGKTLSLYILIALVFLITSVEIGPSISINFQSPDFVLILIVFLAQRKGPLVGMLSGFFMGLFLDFFSGQLIGAMAFCKMTIGLIVALAGSRLIVYSFVTEIATVFLFSLVQTFIFYLELLVFSSVTWKNYVSGVWIGILYTAIVSPIILLILNFFDNKTDERF